MPDAATDLARKLGLTAAQLGKQLRRMIARLVERHDLATRLFKGEDGELTGPAAEWMRRLARDNYVEGPTYNGDRDKQLINEGRRLLALEILGSVRLDANRLGALTKLERDVND